MQVEEHRGFWSGLKVRFCLVVTSDSILKGLKEDEITPLVEGLVVGAGHELVNHKVVPNDLEVIYKEVGECLNYCDVVLVTGGTGLSKKDLSVDAVSKVCVKHIPGFGELFRYLTYLEFGPAAMLSRSYACVTEGSAIFITPGSPQAVRLALTKLILPEVKHLVGELRR